MARAGGGAGGGGRRLLGEEITPALKSAARARLDQLHLAVEDDAATADAVLVGERLDAEDALAAEPLAPDPPEQRAAVEQLIHPFRDHAGAVEAFSRLAGLLLLRGLLLDPVLEVLDGIAADAELDEMQGHDLDLARRAQPGRSFAPLSTSL